MHWSIYLSIDLKVSKAYFSFPFTSNIGVDPFGSMNTQNIQIITINLKGHCCIFSVKKRCTIHSITCTAKKGTVWDLYFSECICLNLFSDLIKIVDLKKLVCDTIGTLWFQAIHWVQVFFCIIIINIVLKN